MPKRVLIVDDSKMIRDILSLTVNAAGYQSECFAKGQDALETLATRHFDIALVDLSMPSMDGFELVRKIRANTKLQSMPIVVITTAAESADRERGSEAGADLYLIKPVDEADLIMNIKMLIGDPR
jgi:DNA-binding response OmpR family regulator